jgi:hypothetical protein
MRNKLTRARAIQETQKLWLRRSKGEQVTSQCPLCRYDMQIHPLGSCEMTRTCPAYGLFPRVGCHGVPWLKWKASSLEASKVIVAKKVYEFSLRLK